MPTDDAYRNILFLHSLKMSNKRRCYTTHSSRSALAFTCAEKKKQELHLNAWNFFLKLLMTGDKNQHCMDVCTVTYIDISKKNNLDQI